MPAASGQPLRYGYSTGACAAAAISAAWQALEDGLTRTASALSYPLLFPDGLRRTLPLASWQPGIASIVKDGGDDPDCTHGALIRATVRPAAPHEAEPHDYLLSIGSGTLILRAGGGIGLCTLPGLDCEQNRWAINAGPRRMIADNLRAAGYSCGCILAELSIERGEALAAKTLNSRLGIVGGLSVLGTTGIVRPFSHEAYIATIRICTRSAALRGADTVVYCTGGRTQAAAQARLPHLPPENFTCIGDFIADSLAAAEQSGIRTAVVACMPGKLCKYAAGYANTHAHRKEQDMQLFLTTLRRHHQTTAEQERAILSCASVRQALACVPLPDRLPLLADFCEQAATCFALHAPTLHIHLLVFDFDGSFLLEHPAPAEPCHP